MNCKFTNKSAFINELLLKNVKIFYLVVFIILDLLFYYKTRVKCTTFCFIILNFGKYRFEDLFRCYLVPEVLNDLNASESNDRLLTNVE